VTPPEARPTHSEAAPPRKPRRLGLYIPWGIAVVAAVGWSLAWLWLSNAEAAGMDAAVAKLRAAGWRVAWSERHIGGYPFRLDIDVTGLVVTDPSGWGLQVPGTLKSEAYAFAPTHLVFYVPDRRMTVTRPGDEPIDVQAGVLRGSLSGVGEGVPNLALEGDDIHFAAVAGAPALPLAAAKNLQFYTRPGPDDQGATYLSVDGGVAAPGSWLAALSAGGPVSLKTDAIFAHASAFAAPTWRAGVAAWAHAGAGLDLQHLELTAGPQSFSATSGRLSVGDDGFLAGQLPLTARGQPLVLEFHDGGAWVGGARVAAAPRLF
jgi:hypothetical protein